MPLLLALAAAAAPTAASDAVDAFAAVCSPASGIEPLRQRAATRGWTAHEPPAGDGLARLLAMGRAALATGKGAIDVLRRADWPGGLTLMLVLAETDDVAVTACRLYGDTSTPTPDSADLARRLGRPPARVVTEYGLTTSTWEPGWASGDDSLELLVVAPGSEAGKILAFSGWALVARSSRATGSGGQ